MWPKLLDMNKDECKRLLRRTELEAYAGMISAFRAQGDLTKDKKHILNELATTLSISTERHRAEVRRAVNDEKLSTVAERLSGPNHSAEWAIEGRRLIPLMPRLVPQTVFSLTANQAANAAFSHNLTLPLPSETAKKEATSENSVKLPSPSSNAVVLPSGLSIPIKGGPDVDVEVIPAKKPRRDSSHSQTKDVMSSSISPHTLQTSSSPSSSMLAMSTTKSASGNVITTNRSLSLPAGKHPTGYNIAASKQQGSRSIVGRTSPLGPTSSTSANKSGFNPAQSPLKFTYTKTSTIAGNSTPSSSAQKVILVSSSSTSYTPSILQRSHSVPSAKSAVVKGGTKQSVILTSVSGQSALSRQSEVVHTGGRQTGVSAGARQQTTMPSASGSNRHKTSLSGRQSEASGGQMTPLDMMPGTIGGMSGVRKQTGNAASVSAMNSTIITARTTASIVSAQMTSYIAPNMAGKPRGRAVSKQKLLKHVTSTSGITTPTGEATPSKNYPMPMKSGPGMKIATQSMAVGGKQRSSNQSPPLETPYKASMATATMATGKPVTTSTGHKVIISTTSAGISPHHVAMTTPLIRTKPSGTVSSMSTVGSKLVPGSAMNVMNPKMVQTIKATTTANVSPSLTSMTQIISSKPSVIMHKSYSHGSQAVASDPSKSPQAHMTSPLLHRPRISMVPSAATTTTAPSFMSTGIRFPSPQSTSSIAMTTVKSAGSRRMRSPITMVTPGAPSSQKRPGGSGSPSTPQSSGNTGTKEDVQIGKQNRDYPGSLTRGLLSGYSHPNSEWIDYDGTPPNSSASSAIKALLEFRSHPDARKHSQTIDLSHIGSKSTTKSTSFPAMPSTQFTTAPSRLPHHPLLTTRVSHHATDMTTVGSPVEGVSRSSPALLSNMQSRLKKALMSDRPAKPASPASCLPSSTAEVEKALQGQNQTLCQAKQDLSLVQAVPTSSSQDGGTRSPSAVPAASPPNKGQLQKGNESQQVTVEDQGVVSERVNVSSEDVSSFVDQFEQFLESEGLQGQGQSQGDPSSQSQVTGQSADSFQSLTGVSAGKSLLTPAQSTPVSKWSDGASGSSVAADTALSPWRNKPDFEMSGQKGGASVVMESSSVDISQMKLEDFTSQRLQDDEDVEDDKQNDTTSPETSPVKMKGNSPNVTTSAGSGSEETQGVRISNRKRKAPAPIDEEPGPTSMSSWARAAFNLLQRVMRFRGANRSKGDLNAASWFTRPVAVAEAPGYSRVIKNPMDFGTVKRKLESGQYDDFVGFHSDMTLVHNNCVQYNPPGHEIRRDCEEVFQFYTAEYSKLVERWEKPSPKKLKVPVDDQHTDKSKSSAARAIILK
ncbi:BRCA2-interacting transcriptional repressor EMSY-like [Patiria miniata]|uniref:Uncharacterized protein n=1 Tax=Patiria miniata TaxID=46514 RepID=A0A913ZFL9_PATMI|nr:BRCA2-interacting transcriptional repressor EMSY-like [Patiria miniata]